MANINTPNGFSPVLPGAGYAWNQQSTLYYIPSSDSNQYNIGDLVKSAAGSDAVTLAPQIVKITNGTDTPRGVIVGFLTDPTNLNIINVPATKAHAYYAWVVDDPNIVMEVTDDGITTANLNAAAVGLNCSFTVANPTAPSPVSASVLNSSTFATTNTLNLKIVGLKRSAGNVAAPFARWLVRFNQHEFFGNTTGA